MYSYLALRTLHLEITSKCNACCPLCPRNTAAGVPHSSLPITELGIGDLKRALPVDFLNQLDRLYLCGNYGDPAMARDTLQFLQYARVTNPKLNLGVHTNAGVRDATWWDSLAKHTSYVRFGIDGLADTHSRYRRHTDWHRVIENASAFIRGGGTAIWDFLVFEHNQHQVDEARYLASELGFQQFVAKRTSRFLTADLTVLDSPSDKRSLGRIVPDSHGGSSTSIAPASDPRYANDVVLAALEYGSFQAFSAAQENAEVHCKAERRKAVYISAEGLVFPCCYTAHLYNPYPARSLPQVSTLIAALPDGFDSISVLKRSVRDIVGDDFFQHVLPDSWGRASYSEGKLEVCQRVCGRYRGNVYDDKHGPITWQLNSGVPK